MKKLFQFRIRTLLILTTIIAIWMSWWSYAAHRQKVAVDMLRQSGATVQYEPLLDCAAKAIPPQWYRWLAGKVGHDYFENVREVSFAFAKGGDLRLRAVEGLPNLKSLDLSHTNLSDADLVHLKNLYCLENLWLDGTDITDKGICCISHLGRVKWLDLSRTNVTDAGLRCLKNLTELERVDLSYTRITDNSLITLSGHRKLRSIDLSGTKITDAGLRNIVAWPELTEIDLNETDITGAALCDVSKLARLRILTLRDTSVTDASLRNLSNLKQSLHGLILGSTRVTDAGISHLTSLKELEVLNLSDTNVTDSGLAALAQALPNCNVSR